MKLYKRVIATVATAGAVIALSTVPAYATITEHDVPYNTTCGGAGLTAWGFFQIDSSNGTRRAIGGEINMTSYYGITGFQGQSWWNGIYNSTGWIPTSPPQKTVFWAVNGGWASKVNVKVHEDFDLLNGHGCGINISAP